MRRKTYFNWSSGKDSALALYKIQQEDQLDVDLLITSVNSTYDRVSMHGLRSTLLRKQVEALGIAMETIELPENPSMEEYEHILISKVNSLVDRGYRDTVFGDIFLEDLRTYRENQLAPYQIRAHFPLWKKDTRALAEEFISLGFKSIIVSCNGDLLDSSFAGRLFDRQFLDDLPDNVDPCGENGEFHTFCYDGPIFNQSVPFTVGEKIKRSYPRPNSAGEIDFWFCELLDEE